MEKQSVDSNIEVSSTSDEPHFKPQDGNPQTSGHVQGARLKFMTLGLVLSILLVNIEVSVIGTALTSIASDLQSFEQSGLIVTSYMVTFSSLLIIWGKISDTFGRKYTLITAQLIFAAFSGGCGASQTLVQLVVCRAFQGVGAAGCISLAIVMMYEMVPASKYPLFMAIQSLANALGSLSGPLIGGAVSQYSTWRWAFLFNAPATVAALLICFFSVPERFPRHNEQSPVEKPRMSMPGIKVLRQLDVAGSCLLLGASMTLVIALLEGGVSFAWDSAASIVLLVVSGVLWLVFIGVEWLNSNGKWGGQAVFPVEWLRNRVWMGTLLSIFAFGVPYILLVVNLPQRFETVNQNTPFEAGIRLIPFNLLISVGGIIASAIVGKTSIPPIHLMFVGTLLQLAGTVPLIYLPHTVAIPRHIYGLQVLVGLGVGFMIAMISILPPHLVERRHLAVASGATIQFRVFGGAIGLAIGSNVLNNYVQPRLEGMGLSANVIADELSNSTARNAIGSIYAEGFDRQMQLLAGFVAVQFVAVAMLWRRPQVSIKMERTS